MSQTLTRCRVCGRKLTAPKSVERGIGPVCLKRRNTRDEYWKSASQVEAET